MNRKVNRIDESGFYIEDVILNEEEITPSDCIDIQCPEGFYKPKWDNNAVLWVEGLTIEEIAAMPLPVDIKAQAIEEINKATTIAGLKAAMLKYINAE